MNRFLDLLKSSRNHPVVVAHRGDSFHAPENTLDAANLAHSAGADAWELDVQLTRDQVPVVLHDESLLRTTDVAITFNDDPRRLAGFRVSDFDWHEVRALNAGSWFVENQGGPRTALSFGTLGRIDQARIDHYRSGRVTVPTLAEALDLTKERDWLVNVEVKSFPECPPGLLDRVLEIVAETGTASHVLISSFDHTDLAAANLPGREYALGILTWTPLYRIDEYAHTLVCADTVHVSAESLGSGSVRYRRDRAARSLRGEVVARLKDQRIPVLVYTVNDHGPDTLAEHMAQVGIDGIFTDDPAGLARYFAANWPPLTENPDKSERSVS
jgi:glycerophosphoryl diester phosphodiesterase